jgi:hypothetical protein
MYTLQDMLVPEVSYRVLGGRNKRRSITSCSGFQFVVNRLKLNTCVSASVNWALLCKLSSETTLVFAVILVMLLQRGFWIWNVNFKCDVFCSENALGGYILQTNIFVEHFNESKNLCCVTCRRVVYSMTISTTRSVTSYLIELQTVLSVFRRK